MKESPIIPPSKRPLEDVPPDDCQQLPRPKQRHVVELFEQEKEAFTLKDTLLTIRDYLFELIKKWYVYVLFIGLGIGGAHYYMEQQKTAYFAKLTFMTNNDGGGGVSAVLQIVGQFGGLGGGGGGGGGGKSEKMIEIFRSKRMVYQTMMKSIDISGKSDLLFNHYIQLFKMHEKWEGSKLQGFRFSPKSPEAFTLEEHTAAKRIYNTIVGKYMNVAASKSGVIQATFDSPVDIFPKYFLEELIKTVGKFYVDKAIQQQRETYQIIKARTDSLEQALFNAEERIAEWGDKHRIALRAGTLTAKRLMEKQRMAREAEVLHLMHSEAAANLEVARMNLLNNTPVIQVIDYPTLPLAKTEPQAQLPTLVAIVMGFLIATVLIMFYKLIKDALKS